MANGKGLMGLWSIEAPRETKSDQEGPNAESKALKEAFAKDMAQVAEVLQQLIGVSSKAAQKGIARKQGKAYDAYL